MIDICQPPSDSIIDRIYDAIKREKGDKELYLTRLGASSIGTECLRRVFYEWRGYAQSDFDGRLLRLFETGHLQEDRIIEDLRRAGLAVWSHSEDGKQFSYTDPSGHLVVKLDGVVKGVPTDEETPHVLEIKTHGKASFADLVKKKVEKAKPEHYYQMQTGMWLSGLTRALYVSLCKDNEEYYVEIVEANGEAFQYLESRVQELVTSTLTPAGISDSASSFGCKFCSVQSVCALQQQPLRHCRTCIHMEPGPEGTWLCQQTGEDMTREQQLKGCDQYAARV